MLGHLKTGWYGTPMPDLTKLSAIAPCDKKVFEVFDPLAGIPANGQIAA
jgi:hypothetical protein